jgi:hypothetical protein
MGCGLRVLTINLRKMVFTQKLKDMSVLNTIEALGIVPGERVMRPWTWTVCWALWGPDPVLWMPATYRLLADKIAGMAENLLNMATEAEKLARAHKEGKLESVNSGWQAFSLPQTGLSRPLGGGSAHTPPQGPLPPARGLFCQGYN